VAGPGAVFAYGAATALATGLGALPFAWTRTVSEEARALAHAAAAGLMLGATFGLVVEGAAHGGGATMAGALAGVAFLLAAQRSLQGRAVRFGPAKGAAARQMWLIVTTMTVHSAAEGVAIGVSFGGSATLAGAITIAIAVHNVPEGLAIGAVLRPRGVSVARCAAWSVASSLPQPLLAVPALLFVEEFRRALPYGVGFAAGAMAFMVLAEMLPEAYGERRRPTPALAASLGLVAMAWFQRLLGGN
jgi:ZIP family zinc transporter